MQKTILHILIKKRNTVAPEIQKVLTKYGCTIKTRLGLHDAGANFCSDSGLVILELVETSTEYQQMAEELNGLENVSAKLVELSI